MTLARRIRCCLAVTATLTAFFVASSASAAMLATNDFETSFADFTADETLAALAAYNGDAPSDAASYPFGSFGDKYLSVDTDDATIWRRFAARSADVYFDSYVKFTPMYDEFAHAADAKFVIYLDSATSNLCVISGTAAGDRTAVTNRLVSAPIVPNTWGRLTVNATASDGVFAFQVKLNGTLLATAGSVSTFYSLSAGTTLSEVGVGGSGALDNFAVRTTDPFLADGDTKATVDGEGFASLEQALEESNGETVTLTADHAASVAVSQSGTYVVDAGSYTFGGIVAAGGALISYSASGNVTTYTVTAPVVVWDGNAADYNFSTLTRTANGITYELQSNSQYDTVDNTYIKLATANQEAAPTITANSGATNPFGNGSCTVIMKCTNMPVASGANRALIALFNSSNTAMIGIKGNNSDGGFIWNGDSYGDGGTQSAVFSSSDQVIAMTYSTANGTSYYVNRTLAASATALKASSFASPAGIALGGLPVSGSTMFYEMRDMRILAVAVFASELTAAEIGSYAFPSEAMVDVPVNMAVSEINAKASAAELYLNVADGVTITGDETFTSANAVHFICDGSFTLVPPADNTATFDFSGVTGKPVIQYAAFPTVSGSVFTSTTVPEFVTDSTKWSGVIYISGGSFTDFTSNAFGNESSIVRLGNVSGWLRAPGNYAFTNSVPVELVGTLTINNGMSANDSYPNRCTVFKKLSGSGTISANNTADKVVVVIQDASEFTGNIGLTGKLIVFGDAMPSYTGNSKFESMTASIWVMEGASVTVNPPSGNWWATGGIKLYGELRTASLNKIGGGTSITTYDTGTFTLTSTSSGYLNDTTTSFARIGGTGTFKYEGTGWRALCATDFPTNMTLVNEQAGDLLLSSAQTYTIGSFAGSKNLQGNYDSGDRYLRVLQAKDTTWSGKITTDGQNRFKGLTVAPGVYTAGTLTLSGTQTQSAAMTVETGAAVNLTGTWVGATTIAGTIGGTGAITGDLTLSAGATLKVSDVADPLSVSGDFAATGTIAIELPAGALDGGACTLLAVGGTADLSGATFTATVGGVSVDLSRHEVKVVNGQLVLQPVSVKRGTGLLLF